MLGNLQERKVLLSKCVFQLCLFQMFMQYWSSTGHDAVFPVPHVGKREPSALSGRFGPVRPGFHFINCKHHFPPSLTIVYSPNHILGSHSRILAEVKQPP